MRPVALACLFMVASGARAADDQWVRLSTPDFELYSNAGEKKAREALQHFEQVRGFFLKASPVKAPTDFPVRIIAFRTKEQFAAYTTNPIALAYFAHSPRRDYIVMQDPSPESYPVAVHEYVHLIVRHSGLHIPLWLNEGLADVYSTLRPVKDGVAVGDLIPGRMQTLASGPWLNAEALSGMTDRSPAYREADRAGIFYAQSWALTHMLFLSPEYRQGFGKFVMALDRGSSLGDAFEKAYGRSSAEVFEDLKGYLGRRKIYGEVFEVRLSKAEPEPEASAMAEFDARLMLADLSAALQRFAEAKQEYERLELIEPARPEVLQSLGFLAIQGRDMPAAKTYFEKAFAAGANDPQMCFLLAGLERDARQPAPEIAAALERAVQSKPDFAEALMQLGVMKISARDFDSAISYLMRIPNVTPERAGVVFSALAYAYLETGDIERARKHAASALKWAHTPRETKDASDLAALIEARSEGPFAVRPGERMLRVEGLLEAVDCSADASRLHVLVGGRAMIFGLPQPKAVEYAHEGGGAAQLRCGPQKPFRVVLDYVPTSVMAQTIAGVVRRIEY